MPYQSNQPFFYSTPDGVDHFVAKGDVVEDKSPVLRGRELLFDALSPSGKSSRQKAIVDVPDSTDAAPPTSKR